MGVPELSRVSNRQPDCPLHAPAGLPVSEEGMCLAPPERLGRKPVPTRDVPDRGIGMAPCLGASQSPPSTTCALKAGHETEHAAQGTAIPPRPDVECPDLLSTLTPFLPMPTSPLHRLPNVRLHRHIDTNGELMSPPGQPQRRPVLHPSLRSHPGFPSETQPAGYGPLPLEAGPEESSRHRMGVGGRRPPFSRMPCRVIGMVQPEGEVSFPFRRP